jgi:hypothetical protein
MKNCKCKFECKINHHTGRHIKIGGKTDRIISGELAKIKPIISGIEYEKRVSTRLGISNIAGASSKIDVYDKDREINIECKTKNAFEGGQISLGVKENNYIFPENEKGDLFKKLLNLHTPFDGRIPSFKNGDKSFETWKREKDYFKSYMLECDSTSISEYYKLKGVDYIQIEEKGLYHTGKDIHNYGIPFFEPKTKIRIRCKQHSSSSMPSSIMLSLNFNKRSLPLSKFSIT